MDAFFNFEAGVYVDDNLLVNLLWVGLIISKMEVFVVPQSDPKYGIAN